MTMPQVVVIQLVISGLAVHLSQRNTSPTLLPGGGRSAFVLQPHFFNLVACHHQCA